MEKHPIESLMGVSMEQIKDMVDVNTVIGDAVQTQESSRFRGYRSALSRAAGNTLSAARRPALTAFRSRAARAQV